MSLKDELIKYLILVLPYIENMEKQIAECEDDRMLDYFKYIKFQVYRTFDLISSERDDSVHLLEMYFFFKENSIVKKCI